MNRFQILKGETPPPLTPKDLLVGRDLRDVILDLASGAYSEPDRAGLANYIRTMTYDGTLDLRGLTSADGLVLPTTLGGSLDLRGLT